MELMHNQVFKIIANDEAAPYLPGIYRVIFVEYHSAYVVCVRIFNEKCEVDREVSIKPQAAQVPRNKKPRAPLVGNLIWLQQAMLDQLHVAVMLLRVEVEREALYFKPLKSRKDKELFERRRSVMIGFLAPENVKEQIIVHSGLGGLVRKAIATTGASRAFIYAQWSTLCRLGFSEISLLPRRDRCGAPGIARPCDPQGRQKPGRKTLEQRIAAKTGGDTRPEQPGMSSEWRIKIMAADRQIKTPVKPTMPTRYNMIIQSAFVQRYRYEGEKLVQVDLDKGTYPVLSQVRRVLNTEVPQLERLLQRTTAGHFSRSLRGLVARNWKGVSGPGHTWAIDSTIGDVYLRSSLNRAWIIGRPIVYVIVDVWSTAVVGFYVCLTGPSWNTAKAALFNTAAPPQLLGDLWGYRPVLSLNPLPTLCHELLCDRGEYLSKAASLTALKLQLDLGYTPPYRPDLKGIVEVLHRIAKDQQFWFVPGAIDARRAEFDLRKSHPEQSAMTVPEFVQYLHLVFSRYNICADRSKRVDAHMTAAGVFPSPAGLWSWGHMMRVGFSRATPLADLITTLLPRETASVGHSSVIFGGNDYSSPTVEAEKWTSHARNFGGWHIPVNYYPGSVRRIWTPYSRNEGLLDLDISDQSNASPELTFDELLDLKALQLLRKSDTEHTRLLQSLQTSQSTKALIKQAVDRTERAVHKERGVKPTMTEARVLEVAFNSSSGRSEAKTEQLIRDEATEAYEQMMHELLNTNDTAE